MSNFSKILWGIFFITLGIVIGLNALNITNIDLLFKGWWTLFIIIPSVIGLFDSRETSKTGNLIRNNYWCGFITCNKRNN